MRKLLKKQKRRANIKLALKGVLAFLKTPLGIFFGIYGFLVVVFGAGLVLLLMIPMDAYAKTLWVEICAQVLTALFTITGIGLFPSRLRDTYWILTISHYARLTRKRRDARGLAKLKDENDLPDAATPSCEVMMIEVRNAAAKDTSNSAGIGSSRKTMIGEEEAVLSHEDLEKLRDAQVGLDFLQLAFLPHHRLILWHVFLSGQVWC